MNTKNLQWFAFLEVRKLREALIRAPAQKRVLGLLTYFFLLDSVASEANLLSLFRYFGLNFNSEFDMQAARDVISFYVGAGLLTIVDNGLGLVELLNDETYHAYKKGKNMDTSRFIEEINRSKSDLYEKIGLESENQ